MTSNQAYKWECKTEGKAIDSEIFNGVTYHLKNGMFGIDAGRNGRIALPTSQVKALLNEWNAVYQTHCEVE